MSTFEELGLHSKLCELLVKNEIDLPTAIQQESIPLILGGGDVCACAETGTGKTLSFIISSLQIIHELMRNIGSYESSNSNNISHNNTTINSLESGKNEKTLIKTLSNNSKVQLNKNECIYNNKISNTFEELNVNCEITNGKYAYEIEVLSKSYINVGFCPFVRETLKYNYTYCSNGLKFTNNISESYSEPYTTNDIITCLINKNSNLISFKKNGKFLGHAFKIFYKYHKTPFFPYVCGKFFHIKFHFKNLKHIDRQYYNELNDLLLGSDETESFCRKIYCDSSLNESDKNGKGSSKNNDDNNRIGNNSNEDNSNNRQNNVPEGNKKKLYCIVLVPTKDLAMQTYNNYLKYSECFTNPSINIGLLVGGDNAPRVRNAHNNIIVCTCYKLMEYIRKNIINMSDIRLLILDEADELINTDEKSVLQIKDICMKYSQLVQIIFFSATLQDQNVKAYISKITNNPIYIDLKYGKNSIPSHIYVCIYYVNKANSAYSYKNDNKEIFHIINNEKLNHMSYEELYEYTDKVHLLNTKRNEQENISLNIKINKLKKLIQIINVFKMQNGIIFCRTNLDCDNVYNFLNYVGDGKAYKPTANTLKENQYSCVVLKGKMTNQERKSNLDDFKEGKVRFLICTDVAARGIDIKNLRYLIILTLSDNFNTFFHKIGRVGRDGENSLCIVLSAENEEERVWYHSCPSRGVNCYNRDLKENKGCTVYINESDYIKSINNLLESEMHVLDSKYFYAQNVIDPLNYIKKHPIDNKSRRNQNQNKNSIFSELEHKNVINNFSSNINNIIKLQSSINCKHYELVNYTV